MVICSPAGTKRPFTSHGHSDRGTHCKLLESEEANIHSYSTEREKEIGTWLFTPINQDGYIERERE